MEISDVTVRHATPSDHATITSILAHTANRPDCARLLKALHDEGAVTLSYLAVFDQKIVGHILFSRLPIVFSDRTEEGVVLTSLAVLPSHRGLGIGGMLVQRGLEACTALGARAAVVRGRPSYYPRFGFSPLLAQTLSAPFFGPDFMAKELVPSSLSGGPGQACYPKSFVLRGTRQDDEYATA